MLRKNGKGKSPGCQRLTLTDMSMNEGADFWRDEIGANVMPADTKNKRPIVEWEQFQNKPIPKELHEYWKKENMFKDGIAIIAGKVWHVNVKDPNNYLICVDLDNKKAIDEFCTRNDVMTPLSELAKTMIVEQHDDEPNKAHIIFYASHPFKKKSSDTVTKSDKLDKNEIPAIEIKSSGDHGILFVTPSPLKNGHNYRIIGTMSWRLKLTHLKHIWIISVIIMEFLTLVTVTVMTIINNQSMNYLTRILKSMKATIDMRHYSESWSLYSAEIREFLAMKK